jgi:uncharacterized protein YcnI
MTPHAAVNDNPEETMKIPAIAAALVVASTPLFAHVGVLPRESRPGATETYTFRVPSEGGKTTTAVVLDVPGGVTIAEVSAPDGAKHEETRTNGRVAQVTWTITVQPGATAELRLVAKNPENGDAIVWKVHQKYTDGTVSDWVGEAGTRSPAPVTKLGAAAPH